MVHVMVKRVLSVISQVGYSAFFVTITKYLIYFVLFQLLFFIENLPCFRILIAIRPLKWAHGKMIINDVRHNADDCSR